MLTRRENLLIRPWQQRRFHHHRKKASTEDTAAATCVRACNKGGSALLSAGQQRRNPQSYHTEDTPVLADRMETNPWCSAARVRKPRRRGGDVATRGGAGAPSEYVMAMAVGGLIRS